MVNKSEFIDSENIVISTMVEEELHPTGGIIISISP